MRGRKPHPTSRRVLDGNPGKRAINHDEPEPPPLDDAVHEETPPELRDHDVAAAEWHRLAPMLRRCRQITEADRAALLCLCLEYEKYLDATAQIKAGGMVHTTKNGYPVPTPYLTIARSALNQCAKLWPELGLTPSSRSRVKTSAPIDGDEFSEFDEPISEPTPKH